MEGSEDSFGLQLTAVYIRWQAQLSSHKSPHIPIQVPSVADAVHTHHQGPHQAIPQSSVYFQSQEDLCLATAEVMLDTPSPKDIIRSVLHYSPLSSPRRMHKDIHSGKDGRGWEMTGSTMHCWIQPRCYSHGVTLVSHSTPQMVSVVKNPPANAGEARDTGSVLGRGRSSGGGHGNPLQYSCLDNLMSREAWWATVQRVTVRQD